MKINKIIFLFSALALIFVLGCEKEVLTSNENDQATTEITDDWNNTGDGATYRDRNGQGPGGGGPPGQGGGGGGGDPELLYKVTYVGTYFNSTWYGPIGKSNKKSDSIGNSEDVCGRFEMGDGDGLFCDPDDFLVAPLVTCVDNAHIYTQHKSNAPGSVVARVDFWDGDSHSPFRSLLMEGVIVDNGHNNGNGLFTTEVPVIINLERWRFGGGRYLCPDYPDNDDWYDISPGDQQIKITATGSTVCPTNDYECEL